MLKAASLAFFGLALGSCDAPAEAPPAEATTPAIPKATERQRLQILELRANSANPVAIFYGNGRGASAIFSARGVPLEIGITGMTPVADGYRLDMWIGNLSSVIIGDCHATFSLSVADKSDAKEVPVPGMFSPAEVSKFSFTLPSTLKNATGLALSAPVCTSAFYPD